MTKNSGPTRKPGQPRNHDYDLQLALHVDLGTAVTGKSVNAFAKKHPFRLSDGTMLEEASLRRRYYERRMLMAPVVWPNGKQNDSPVAEAYAKFLAEVKATFGVGV